MSFSLSVPFPSGRRSYQDLVPVRTVVTTTFFPTVAVSEAGKEPKDTKLSKGHDSTQTKLGG